MLNIHALYAAPLVFPAPRSALRAREDQMTTARGGSPNLLGYPCAGIRGAKCPSQVNVPPLAGDIEPQMDQGVLVFLGPQLVQIRLVSELSEHP